MNIVAETCYAVGIGEALSLSTTAGAEPALTHKPFTRRQSIGLVFCCTLLGAAAQILMKSGANTLTHFSIPTVITNIPLMIGYSLYGLSTVLLVLALRDGELSLLYPVIALTYVWVTMLSLFFFQERMNVP